MREIGNRTDKMFAELRNDLIISFLPPANRFEFSQEKRKLSNCHTTQPTSYLLFNLGGTLSLKLSGHFISRKNKLILFKYIPGVIRRLLVTTYFSIHVPILDFYKGRKVALENSKIFRS